MSYNTERGKASGKPAAQEGVLVNDSVHMLVRESETQETNASPFYESCCDIKGLPRKVWAPRSGDLSAFASSARLHFQTRGKGFHRERQACHKVTAAMPRAHFALMDDTKHFGHKVFRLRCLAVITRLPFINPVLEWFTAPSLHTRQAETCPPRGQRQTKQGCFLGRKRRQPQEASEQRTPSQVPKGQGRLGFRL